MTFLLNFLIVIDIFAQKVNEIVFKKKYIYFSCQIWSSFRGALKLP